MNKNLKYEDRIKIELCIREGKTIKEISNILEI
ncbi:Uncharacterised protein [Streptobacillus moniliformis]|nr:Uncharacterised protein [Streptobacillus moniliformis]